VQLHISARLQYIVADPGYTQGVQPFVVSRGCIPHVGHRVVSILASLGQCYSLWSVRGCRESARCANWRVSICDFVKDLSRDNGTPIRPVYHCKSVSIRILGLVNVHIGPMAYPVKVSINFSVRMLKQALQAYISEIAIHMMGYISNKRHV
jgi:hypothetical protein